MKSQQYFFALAFRLRPKGDWGLTVLHLFLTFSCKYVDSPHCRQKNEQVSLQLEVYSNESSSPNPDVTVVIVKYLVNLLHIRHRLYHMLSRNAATADTTLLV